MTYNEMDEVSSKYLDEILEALEPIMTWRE